MLYKEYKAVNGWILETDVPSGKQRFYIANTHEEIFEIVKMLIEKTKDVQDVPVIESLKGKSLEEIDKVLGDVS